jgi:hypothetical protein
MPTVISLELRWFFSDDAFDVLEKWFVTALPGSQISAVDQRDDIYLFQPGVENCGIKLRDGRVEIKWRQWARTYESRGRIGGQAERWIKWKLDDLTRSRDGNVAPLGFPDGPWITVHKQRRQRKYEWRNEFVPQSANDMLDVGVAMEITRLAVRGRRYATALVESFAADEPGQAALLDRAVENLLRDFPSSLAARELSYGYPCWLNRVAEVQAKRR